MEGELVKRMALFPLRKPDARNPTPETRNPTPEIRNPENRNPKPQEGKEDLGPGWEVGGGVGEEDGLGHGSVSPQELIHVEVINLVRFQAS